MSWFATGKDTVENHVKTEEERRKNRPPNRVWLKPGTSKNVIFLDEIGFSFQEHAIEVKPKRWEQFTCPGKTVCPICATNEYSYLITLFSVIDLSKYTDSKGVVHENEKIVLAVKSAMAKTLFDKSARWGGLRGKVVIVSRQGDKSASSGSDFELAMKDGKAVAYNLPADNPKYAPYDYSHIYRPKSPQEIRQLLGLAPLGGNAVMMGEPMTMGAPTELDLPASFTEAPVGLSENGDVPF